MPGFGSVGPWEIILILAILLLVFGAKRLPEIGAALGKGIREFKGSVKEIENEFNRPQNLPPQGQQPPAQNQPPQQQVQQPPPQQTVQQPPQQPAQQAPPPPAQQPQAPPQQAQAPTPEPSASEVETTKPQGEQ
jgi:sec-independent protein translocase protein TatA